MYVCVYIYVYIYVENTYIYIYRFICVFIFILLFLFIFIFIFIFFIYIHIYIYIYIDIDIEIYIYVIFYIYIYIYMVAHILNPDALQECLLLLFIIGIVSRSIFTYCCCYFWRVGLGFFSVSLFFMHIIPAYPCSPNLLHLAYHLQTLHPKYQLGSRKAHTLNTPKP